MDRFIQKWGPKIIWVLGAGVIGLGSWAFQGVCEENEKQAKQIEQKVDNHTLQMLLQQQKENSQKNWEEIKDLRRQQTEIIKKMPRR